MPRRLISLFAAICLIISLVPAVAAEDAPAYQKYVFSSTAACNGVKTRVQFSNSGTDRHIVGWDDYAGIISSKTDPWQPVASRSQHNWSCYPNGMWFRVQKAAAGDASKNGMLIKIHVDKRGVYMPTVNYSLHGENAVIEAHFISGERFAEIGYTESEMSLQSIALTDPDGSVNAYAAGISGDDISNANVRSFNCRPVELTEGDNYVEFSFNGYDAAQESRATFRMFIQSVELSEVTPVSVSAGISNSEISVGTSARISASAMFSNGETYSGGTYTYESSDPTVAFVNETGSVIARKEGSAVITVTLVGTELSATVNVTTVKNSGGAAYKYNFTKKAVGTEGTDSYTSFSEKYGTWATGDGTRWQPIGLRSAASARILDGGTGVTVKTENVEIDGSNGIVFKIDVPTGGKYIPVLHYDGSSVGANIKTYILSESYVNSKNWDMSNGSGSGGIKQVALYETPIGITDTYNANGKSFHFDCPGSAEFSEMELEKGEYYLVFSYDLSYNPAIVGATSLIGEVAGFELRQIVPTSLKAEPTIYSYEMREKALENIRKYSWAKKLRNTAVANANLYAEHVDDIYALITYEGIPRSASMMLTAAPSATDSVCPYCGNDIKAQYGGYGWIVDGLAKPWKVQCPACKSYFPSNDFELLYKRGLDENGRYNRELAIQNNAAAVARGEKDALKNELYPGKGNTWMVDAGFGWSVSQGYTGTSRTDRYCPIAYFNHYIWGMNGTESRSLITKALNNLRDAYLYTGDLKYGRAGAKLIDRVADVYPSFDLTACSLNYSNSQGSRNSGKIVGCIWEAELAEMFIRAYDAFFPVMDDDEVVAFASQKAEEEGLENPKLNGNMIRANCENGIIREAFEAAKTEKIHGNFPMYQLTIACAAVALDTYPETNEMFEWLESPSTTSYGYKYCPIYGNRFSVYNKNTGGEMLSKLVNDVDRDGFGNEVAVGYNSIWVTNSLALAEVIGRYVNMRPEAECNINLFANPKFIKMFDTFIKETAGNGYTLQLGDSGSAASTGLHTMSSELIRAFAATGNHRIAQNYYFVNGGNLENTYADIFTDADSLASDISAIIETDGERELKSESLTGFGLAMLRGGDNKNGEHRYDTWMFYGMTAASHGHEDCLGIGIDAYGFNFSPDLGYPSATGHEPNREQWVRASISHNTVLVNDATQKQTHKTADPLHFDDAGKVKLADVSAPDLYDAASIYRRTLLTVEADDTVAYTVDFFRVKGGSSHTYSFHSQSNKGYTTDLALTPQVDSSGKYVGTYAGRDVPYGKDPNTPELENSDCTTKYPRGYTWLTNVDRATPSSGKFTVNFEQTDFKGQVEDPEGLNIRYTALNSWTPSGVGLVTGYAPATSSNKQIPGLDYMLIHRTGSNLDTLFTSVFEPYKGEEYISDMQSVTATLKSGTETADDTVKAIKVVLTSGRTDYIIYATNNTVTYTVTDGDISFDFRGFVGVYSVDETGKNVYSYVNDGDIIGNMSATAAYTGTVESFTKTHSSENTITLSGVGDADVSDLAERYVRIENDGVQNGVYRIVSAENGENGSVVLNIGDVTPVRSYLSNSDFSGYIYNIAEGQNAKIALSANGESKLERNENVYKYSFLSSAFGFDKLIRWSHATDPDTLITRTESDIIPSLSSPWLLLGARGLNNGQLHTDGIYWNYRATASENGTAVVLRMKVPESGLYTPKLTYKTMQSSMPQDIYISKLTASDETNLFGTNSADVNVAVLNRIKAMKASEKLGTVNMFGTGETKTQELSETELTEGEYILIFSTTGEKDEGFVPYAPSSTELAEQKVVSLVLDGTSGPIVGDADGNGKIEVADGMWLSRYLAGWTGFEISEISRADTNNDGQITVIDDIILSRYLAGWTEFLNLPYAKK